MLAAFLLTYIGIYDIINKLNLYTRTAMLYKIKNNLFASIIWTLISCIVHLLIFKSKVNPDYQIWERLLFMLMALCFTIPIHELIHFILMKVFCKGTVKIRSAKSPIGLPSLMTEAQGEFQKWQLVIVYLAPFVLLTVLFDIVFVFCAEIELVFFIVASCNCVGCFYDIIDALITITNKNE